MDKDEERFITKEGLYHNLEELDPVITECIWWLKKMYKLGDIIRPIDENKEVLMELHKIQAELMKKMGVHLSMIFLYEKGERCR
jgi:hypothetical protein